MMVAAVMQDDCVPENELQTVLIKWHGTMRIYIGCKGVRCWRTPISSNREER